MNPLGIIGYPLLLIAVSEALLGFILLRRNPRNSPLNKTVAAFSFFSAGYALFAGIVYVRASIGLDYDLFYRACWIGWFCIPAGAQFLYYIYERRKKPCSTYDWSYPLSFMGNNLRFVSFYRLCRARNLFSTSFHRPHRSP